MFSVIRKTDFSLRALIYLSKQGDRIVTREEIANALGVPSESFALALRNLSKQRLLRSFRGTGGGFTLGRPAREITLLQIVEAVEGPIVLNHCLHDKASCNRQQKCNIHEAWRNIQNQLIILLDGTCLEEISNTD